MTEWIMIAAMATGGILFAAGGTDIPGIGGQKWIRRYILPLALGLMEHFAYMPFWKVCCFVVSLSVVLHFPYGDKTPLWRKALTFASYSLSTLWLGLSWWQLILPPSVLGVYLLSNWKWSSNTFLWKICEFIIGSLIGIVVASLIAYHK